MVFEEIKTDPYYAAMLYALLGFRFQIARDVPSGCAQLFAKARRYSTERTKRKRSSTVLSKTLTPALPVQPFSFKIFTRHSDALIVRNENPDFKLTTCIIFVFLRDKRSSISEMMRFLNAHTIHIASFCVSSN